MALTEETRARAMTPERASPAAAPADGKAQRRGFADSPRPDQREARPADVETAFEERQRGAVLVAAIKKVGLERGGEWLRAQAVVLQMHAKPPGFVSFFFRVNRAFFYDILVTMTSAPRTKRTPAATGPRQARRRLTTSHRGEGAGRP